MFKEGELKRYNRNILIIGNEGQEKLKKSRVAIFGLGGLGNFVSLNLVLVGVGKIFLLDKDKVEIENLNRQFLFTEKDVGRKKVEVAKERLKEINPYIEIETFDKDISELDPDSVREYDLFIDCFDNWDARRKLFDIAEKLRKPVVHGAVEGWKGQVGFLRKFDKFKKFKSRENIGVLASAVSFVASIQSALAIRYLLEEKIEDFLMFVDLKKFRFEKFKI